MTSREGKDTPLQFEKRLEKSKEVTIQFTSPNSFNVMNEGKIKYFGKLNPDECSCDSFFYGMKFRKIGDTEKIESMFENENGHNFQCKHILRAKEIMK